MIHTAKEKMEEIILLYEFHFLTNIQTFIFIFYICCYLVFVIAVHRITRLLLD